ncbi:MAG: hypothetical protein U0350_08675 [Caldilineaceae bacterium]
MRNRFKRIFKKLFLPIILIAVSSGCGPAPLPAASVHFNQPANQLADATFKLYQDPGRQFGLQYPATWLAAQSKNSPGATHFVNVATPNAADRVVVTVMVQGPTHDLNKVASAAQQTIADQAGVAELALVSEQGIEVNGLHGVEHVLYFTLSGQSMAQQIVYLVHPEHTFALSLMCRRDKLPTYAPLFAAILRSFNVP